MPKKNKINEDGCYPYGAFICVFADLYNGSRSYADNHAQKAFRAL